MKDYDIAAYVWPSYTGKEPRTKIFWPDGIGEWQTVKSAKSFIEGDDWPRKPLLGYQEEADAKVMEEQIELACKYGVNVFIYDWYWFDRRPFLEQCLNEGFLKARNCNKMQFYLMWANHDATTLWDKRMSEHYEDFDYTLWLGTQDRKEFEIIVDRIINKYFKKDNYYKIDGCPVFSIYQIYNFIKGFGCLEKAREAVEYFREQTKKAGFKDLHLQFTIGNEDLTKPCPLNDTEKGRFKYPMDYLGADSFTHYQMCSINWTENITHNTIPYLEKLKQVKAEWDRIDRSNYNQKFYPHISVGWNTTPRFNKFIPYCLTECTSENIQKAFEMAKDYLDNHSELTPKLVTVNSWNEWTETSYLLPDDVNGYGYLEALKKVFKG